jgi:thiamine-phosphate pyrophosphorylase
MAAAPQGNSARSADGSAEKTPRCRLYLITPPRIELARFAEDLARALDAGDVAALQIRLKDASDDEVRRATEKLLPVAQSRGVAVLMNDRADLAVQLGCDGAHLGQDDGDHAGARKLLGERTLGITCHDSRHLAMEAGEIGADYVAFGAFFPTDTKETVHRAGVDLLEWWSELFEIPCCAIGGITAGNCAPLVRAGADFLCVIGAVWNHPEGPAEGVRAMNAAIASALG